MANDQLEPGSVIAGKYVVESVLGRGGMGTVYAVEHRETGKRLALKCLLPVYVDNPSIVERFIREAKAVGRVQHRHVIDVFDQGRDGSVLYIVLPLLEGKPLSDLLHDEKLTLDEALLILTRAMEGVAAAHAIGVLHRDLKPSNIFVCLGVSGRLDDPRVLDFGISKRDGDVEPALTRSGVAVGTPYYMPIEQLTGQRDLDARVDVYAMGVILYEAISGKMPHSADNVAALALRLMHTPPVHLAVRRPDLSPGLAAVVMRALARERDHRYASMRELIDAVVPFISDGAGLMVREPVGVRLRTPRDTGDTSVSDEMADGAATTKAAVPVVPDPAARPATAQGSLAPPASLKRRRARVFVGGTAALAVGAMYIARTITPEPTVSHAPAAIAGFHAGDAGAALEELRRSKPTVAAPLPERLPLTTTADASVDASPPSTRTAVKTRRGPQKVERRVDALPAIAAPPVLRASDLEAPTTSQPGTRAGDLSPDEF